MKFDSGRVVESAIALAMFAIAAACHGSEPTGPSSAVFGTLVVNVAGLPPGRRPNAYVTTSTQGGARPMNQGSNVMSLVPGRYSIEANQVGFGDSVHWQASPTDTSVYVWGRATVTVSVTYYAERPCSGFSCP